MSYHILFIYKDMVVKVEPDISEIAKALKKIILENSLYPYEYEVYYPKPNPNEAYYQIKKDKKLYTIKIKTEPPYKIDEARSYILRNLLKIDGEMKKLGLNQYL